jgi:hypothetical protein
MIGSFRMSGLLRVGLGGIGLVLTLFYLGSGNALGQNPYGLTVQFASSSYTVNENAGAVVLTVTLSGSTTNTVTVNYATSDGTAVANTDYTAASGTVTFKPGVTSQTVSVGIIDNGNYSDQSVYFTATLSNPVNATLGTPSTTTVNILDNDPAPTADIEINGVPTAQKKNPGGYVQVNANNDNGSALTYADGKTKLVAPNTYGIPQMRDFDPKNVKLAAADPDLVQITLKTTNLKPGGPENQGRLMFQVR